MTSSSRQLGGNLQVHQKEHYAPTFKPYDNQQIQMILLILRIDPRHTMSHAWLMKWLRPFLMKVLFSHYKGGGRSSFHPKMMLKVILYGYSQKVYSCRGIEKLLQENIPAMWLAAMTTTRFSYVE